MTHFDRKWQSMLKYDTQDVDGNTKTEKFKN